MIQTTSWTLTEYGKSMDIICSYKFATGKDFRVNWNIKVLFQTLITKTQLYRSENADRKVNSQKHRSLIKRVFCIERKFNVCHSFHTNPGGGRFAFTRTFWVLFEKIAVIYYRFVLAWSMPLLHWFVAGRYSLHTFIYGDHKSVAANILNTVMPVILVMAIITTSPPGHNKSCRFRIACLLNNNIQI